MPWTTRLFRRKKIKPAPLVFDSDFLRRLEVLILQAARASGSLFHGHRLGRTSGGQLEFRDYRDYSPGDDLRFLDWNLYARLDKPMIKNFHHEEPARLSLLLDFSGSMRFGSPPKWMRTLRLAAAAGHVALLGSENVEIRTFGVEHPESAVFHGRTASAEFFRFLGGLRPPGANTDSRPPPAEPGTGKTGIGAGGRGAVLVIGDAWWGQNELQRLAGYAQAVGPTALVRVLAREDLQPPAAGSYRLYDSETGAGIEMAGGEDLEKLYREAVKTQSVAVEKFCSRAGVRYAAWPPDKPLEQIVLDDLVRDGFLGARG